MPKFVLDAEFDYDFSLLSISSSEPDYKICIHLNRLLGIELSRVAPVELSHKNMKTPLAFSCFLFEEEEEENHFTLIANRSVNTVSLQGKNSAPSLFDESVSDVSGFLVPELLQADYLFMIRAGHHEKIRKQLLLELKKLDIIRAVQEVDPETLSSKKNLIV